MPDSQEKLDSLERVGRAAGDLLQQQMQEIATLRTALRNLERAATEVARYGAQTGPQWTKLSGALISARLAMEATDGKHDA